MDKRNIISARNIRIGYPKMRSRSENCLYENLSFDLYEGELVCLLGTNGAGKSTLLRTISNAQATLAGNINLDGENINNYSEKKLASTLGLVLTDKTSSGGLTARELVELGRYPYTGFFGQLTSEDKEIVEQSMVDVGIVHKANSFCAELSDGERQKAMIAKVLAQQCPIILLDEPTAFLDISSRMEITNLLHNLAIKHNKTILLSTHDIDLALLLADRLWLLSHSQGLECGATEDIVVSGRMDNFFDSTNIRFDKATGSFLPRLNNDRKAYIEAEGYLYYWCKNLLARHGYNTADNEQDAIFCIEVKAADNILFEKDGETVRLHNFESINNYI